VGRAFILVLDDLGMTLRDVTDARRAISSFVDRSLLGGDRVALSSTGGEPWWTGRIPEDRDVLLARIARLQGRGQDPALSIDYMSDYEAYVINRRGSASSIGDRVAARWLKANQCSREMQCASLVRARAAAVDAVRRSRTLALLEALSRSMESLASMRGRKALMLFSRGFSEDPDIDLREVMTSSREANAAVYFIDVRGLEALSAIGMPSVAEGGPAPAPADRTTRSIEDSVLDSAGARSLAEETGGFAVRNTNNLAAAMERVAAETRTYYLLGFHPASGKPPGEWRRLGLKVAAKGLSVRARRGYRLRG
jgi:VWFA-related protein